MILKRQKSSFAYVVPKQGAYQIRCHEYEEEKNEYKLSDKNWTAKKTGQMIIEIEVAFLSHLRATSM